MRLKNRQLLFLDSRPAAPLTLGLALIKSSKTLWEKDEERVPLLKKHAMSVFA